MIDVFFNMKQMPNQPPEFTYGNKEYKLSLGYRKEKQHKINDLLEKKASQMLFRIFEGDGKAKYLIGVEDNGFARGIEFYDLILSLRNIVKITKKVSVEIEKMTLYRGSEGYIASVKLGKSIGQIL